MKGEIVMGLMNKFFHFLGIQAEQDELEKTNYSDSLDEYETQATDKRNKYKANIVSIHSQKNLRVVLSEPRTYEETQEIADHLRNKRMVVVNLQRLRPELAVRLVDFLTGTVYAINGAISKIGPNIFICTPDNVDINGHIGEVMDGESWS
jgi:cell division inhibitor SepF